MKKLKVLNLYAGIGGNRKLWEDVEVTAVEIDPEIAKIYQDYFPNDTVIVGDAHQYLLDHFKEFDFIWSSPPCQTHSRARYRRYNSTKPIYPDMTLWQEIIFLTNYGRHKLWAIENVVPFYHELIASIRQVGRHKFWSNFYIGDHYFESDNIRLLSGKSFVHKLERNQTDPRIGLYILNCARNIITKQNEKTNRFI